MASSEAFMRECQSSIYSKCLNVRSLKLINWLHILRCSCVICRADSQAYYLVTFVISPRQTAFMFFFSCSNYFLALSHSFYLTSVILFLNYTRNSLDSSSSIYFNMREKFYAKFEDETEHFDLMSLNREFASLLIIDLFKWFLRRVDFSIDGFSVDALLCSIEDCWFTLPLIEECNFYLFVCICSFVVGSLSKVLWMGSLFPQAQNLFCSDDISYSDIKSDFYTRCF